MREPSPAFIDQLRPYRRIVVLGTTGSGKSTLSRQLSDKLGLPIIELDEFMHGSNWTTAPEQEFRAKVDRATSQEAWIVDGNYGLARDLIWDRAEAIVWLNYSFARTFRQLLWRTLRRAWHREVLWNGNRESLVKTFFTRESILWWAIKTHHQKAATYPKLFAEARYRHLKILIVRDPIELTLSEK